MEETHYMVLQLFRHNNSRIYVAIGERGREGEGGSTSSEEKRKMVGVLFTTLCALVYLSITVTRQPTQQFGKSWQAEIE